MKEGMVIVGDVHGDYPRLMRMLEAVERLGRRTLFLGDYVNRGPESARVLETLSSLARTRTGAFTFLMGNHELGLLDYLRRRDFVSFARMGGMATIRSYVGEAHGDVHAAFTRSFPPEHRTFLESLEPFWESEQVLVSHVGYDPDVPGDRSVRAMVASAHPRIFRHQGAPAPLVVCGHYVQTLAMPHVSERLICIDTGCGTQGGPLTAVVLPERTFISV